MQYMLLFYIGEEDVRRREDPAQVGDYFGAWNAYVQAISEAGVVVNGHGLQGPEMATTVRIRNQQRQIQDGPFAASKEQLGGYFVIEVAHLDEALEWAARSPNTTFGSTEVRPVLPRG